MVYQEMHPYCVKFNNFLVMVGECIKLYGGDRGAPIYFYSRRSSWGGDFALLLTKSISISPSIHPAEQKPLQIYENWDLGDWRKRVRPDSSTRYCSAPKCVSLSPKHLFCPKLPLCLVAKDFILFKSPVFTYYTSFSHNRLWPVQCTNDFPFMKYPKRIIR